MVGTHTKMYKVEIVKKNITKGKLIVEVLFTKDEESFSDIFETTQSQDSNWISEQIKRRLGHLNSLIELSNNITLGEFLQKEKVKSEVDIYREKTNLYLKYMDTARLGVITPDRPVIQELRKWLRDNFKDEYINL